MERNLLIYIKKKTKDKETTSPTLSQNITFRKIYICLYHYKLKNGPKGF